ncbi:hypothetical protein RND71_031939 [Anisodus tanguticus]|uniref:Uncharacterized protein n=1 Tax=Anisodus tanguticus TaxID=243964 RepID=A0AAE1RBN2_9SOLA|nr:hypothetical protein RND71_031939 [Anisodus tanguticus]
MNDLRIFVRSKNFENILSSRAPFEVIFTVLFSSQRGSFPILHSVRQIGALNGLGRFSIFDIYTNR